MNRFQRKYGRGNPKKEDDELKVIKTKNEIEEVFSPKSRRNQPKFDRTVANRSCYIKPKQKDEGQSMDSHSLDLHFKDLIKQQYEFDPVFPDTIKNLKALGKVMCSSQSTNTKPRSLSYMETSDGSHWQNAHNTAELELLLSSGKEASGSLPKTIDSKNIYISEEPRVKVIAEKFSKLSRNNVELRKLDEKIVCIEYDVFESLLLSDDKDLGKPVQKMRAYFSVRPTSANGGKTVSILPSTIKNKLHINEEDLEKLNEKEIEIIDEKIAENKPYLDELKRLLKRKQAIDAKKKKSSLDLKSLYHMAKSQRPCLDEDFSNTNLLSKAELDEIKELVTKKCASSMYGINRHTLKCDRDPEPKPNETLCMNVISKSIYAELTRNDESAS
ncbi:uncharacterized protein LOC120630100 [Pararge aegeria]|uniref:Jg5786 protein n=1 Tax=Pararge aegeria aegeria TaxID=348720 RepID=A0A8S4R6D1_9NEOP|nr:uncharacterized protein LOC120630100 [Pararge aegeria]CAH2229754.1 jg5786 [Pararge aegeria aegeria]